MPKLQAKISQPLHDFIIQAKIELDSGKGKVLQHLLALALANPEAPKRDFGTTEDKSCTLEISKSEWSDTQSYRSLHSLDTKVSYFRDALVRGASVYLDAKDAADGVDATQGANGAAQPQEGDGEADAPPSE